MKHEVNPGRLKLLKILVTNQIPDKHRKFKERAVYWTAFVIFNDRFEKFLEIQKTVKLFSKFARETIKSAKLHNLNDK